MDEESFTTENHFVLTYLYMYISDNKSRGWEVKYRSLITESPGAIHIDYTVYANMIGIQSFNWCILPFYPTA